MVYALNGIIGKNDAFALQKQAKKIAKNNRLKQMEEMWSKKELKEKQMNSKREIYEKAAEAHYIARSLLKKVKRELDSAEKLTDTGRECYLNYQRALANEQITERYLTQLENEFSAQFGEPIV